VQLAKVLAATLIFGVGVGFGCTAGAPAQAAAQANVQPSSPSQKMAATVLQQWPVSTHDQWAYEEGTLLDGIAAEWHTTANGDDFAYIKAAVDKYVTDDGVIATYKASGHTLDDIEMGRADLLLYRVTQQEKYAKAAKFLHDQLDQQPRTASGGYWHKQIYPNQMWLDGAYMAEPFRAAYAATFQQPADFDDIAKQFLLMYDHMRDPDTGLLRHGWDESKQMPWADKKTGLSPEAWARAEGWYCMALVDVLDWFPQNHPQRAKLVATLEQTLNDVMQYQDIATGLWWQVLDQGPDVTGTIGPGKKMQYKVNRPAKEGNYLEASASAMYIYAIAKSVRMGYLPQTDEESATKAWNSFQKKFVTTNADGTLTLHGTVKVGGLGGTPYRSGTFDYYIHEPVVDQDAKGVGAFLLAGSEMEQSSTEALGQGNWSYLLNGPKGKKEKSAPGVTEQGVTAQAIPGKGVTALMDAWFSSQTRKTALGQTELYHYKWSDDSNSGYSFFGRAFRRYGVTLATLPEAPTRAALAQAQVYIIASPDIPSKNPTPHYMDKPSGDAIEAWVKAGGVLLLFSNDRDNTEFEHYNTLADRFGIHFNPVLSHHVVEPDHSTGEVVIPPGTGIFGSGFTAYMKDTSTIAVSGPAKAVVTDHGDIMIAVAHVGKGSVLAVVDPWFYNEYADGRKMRQYDGLEAAEDVAAWALKQSSQAAPAKP